MTHKRVRAKSPRPVAIDLFSGAGGLSLGLEQAGFDVILAIDRDPHHVATFRRNFPQATVVCADIARLDGRAIRRVIGDVEVDLICGGPPCQGFSHIGKRHSSDPRNVLMQHFVRLVLQLRPKAFLMENVPGLQSMWIRSWFEDALERLNSAGYRITKPVRSLDASHFSVPQRRKRLFVIGTRNEFETLVTYPSSSCRHRPSSTSVWNALRDLPSLSGREELFDRDVWPYRPMPASRLHPYAALARGEVIDPCDLAYPRVWNRRSCSGCSRVKHRPDVVRLYAATARGAMVPSHNLPKLAPRGLAPTLRAGTDGEHGSFNAPRPIHPYQPRCISVREAARLHGFPDWFGFFPAKWHAHRQIGNSVCPPVARALGFAIRRALRLRASRPSKELELCDKFEVPKRRGKRVQRISQLTEWPKVLEYLLRKAGPSADGRLRKSTFSVRDVAEAYRRTDARMPRTPPGRLLSDIARSRNRLNLLKHVHDRGYSIAHIGENGLYGRFVPIGTLGSLETVSGLTISRSEIATAKRVTKAKGISQSFAKLIAFLQRPSVSRTLLSSGRFARVGQLPRRIVKRAVIRCAVQSGGRQRKGIIAVANHRGLPELSSIRSLMEQYQVGLCVVVTSITRRHVAAFLVVRRGDRTFVKTRSVFETCDT